METLLAETVRDEKRARQDVSDPALPPPQERPRWRVIALAVVSLVRDALASASHPYAGVAGPYHCTLVRSAADLTGTHARPGRRPRSESLVP
jgi:hypothetical protein